MPARTNWTAHKPEIERRLRNGENNRTIIEFFAETHGIKLSVKAVSRVRGELGLPTVKPVVHRGSQPADVHRAEIEERTRNGESCDDIATALQSQYDVEISSKTISRRRVEWGFRARAARNDTIVSKARPKNPLSRLNLQKARRAEITERTERGETAEQIAEALMADGVELKKGAATVWRLQTFWGLIEPDVARSRGKQTAANCQARANEKGKARSKGKAAAKAAVPAGPQPITFYPPNCVSGPKLHRHGASEDSAIEISDRHDDDREGDTTFNGLDDDMDDDDSVAGGDTMFLSGPADAQPLESLPQNHGQAHSNGSYQPVAPVNMSATAALQPYAVTAEDMMSAELMVDLSISILGAANHVKGLLTAVNNQRPTAGSPTGLPPTYEEVMHAKLQLKKAAKCVWELADDGRLDEKTS